MHIWRQRSDCTRLVLLILLYAAETWTLLAIDEKALEAFHIKCQRQILDIRCYDFITNSEVSSRRPTGQPSITSLVVPRRQAVFGHVARLKNGVFFQLTTPYDVKLGFHPDAHGRAGSTNSGVVPQSFQLTYHVKQNLVAMEERHYGPRWLCDHDDDGDDDFKTLWVSSVKETMKINILSPYEF